ncbi:MAG: hypothetical protein RSA27_08135, partial [Oscillospiraceae bacterium]
AKIGLFDEPGKAWWLRTPLGPQGDGNHVLCTSESEGNVGKVFSNNSQSSNLDIRPIFYLKKDFFKTVKLDISKTGANVISSIKQNYTKSELSGIYTEDELINGFGYKSGVSISNVSFSDMNRNNVESIEGLSEFNVSGDLVALDENASGDFIVAVYDKNNMLKVNEIQKFLFSPGEASKNINIKMTVLNPSIGDYAKAMVWDTNMNPLCTPYETKTITAKLNGIYETHQNIKIDYPKITGANTIFKWYVSDVKNGTYNEVLGSSLDSFYIKEEYANKWIKAEVTQNSIKCETEPRQVGGLLYERMEPLSGDKKLTNITETAPKSALFSTGGQEFILLDTTESSESRFLVMSRKTAGKRKFSTSGGQNFSELKTWLNGEFLTLNKLPENVKTHINKDATWKIEPYMYPQGAVSAENTVTAGVVIPSLTEVKKYKNKIGFYEDLGMGWWTRTPMGTPGDENAILAANSDAMNMGCFFPILSQSEEHGIRPMFYLNREFFKNVKIDVNTAGADVKRAITTNYSPSELSIYTAEEIATLFSRRNIEITAENVYDSSKNQTVNIAIDVNEMANTPYKIELYSDGVLVGFENFDVKENHTKTHAIPIDNLKNGTHLFKAVVYRNSNIAEEKTWNTAVMEVYEPHAMECLSLKGYSANISDPRDVELAIKSGVKMARGSMEWNDVERVKGVYDFTEF